MPDVYADITHVDAAILDSIADALESRAADEQQQSFLKSYLERVPFPPDSRVLDIGCGTGPISRVLAEWDGIGEVVGVDPSPAFIDRARNTHADRDNLSFQVGDGSSLTFEPASFDVAIFHTVLCHVPQREEALIEASRVLKPGGWLAVFDGDYATSTLALGDHDPLQVCCDAFFANFVDDRWMVRRLPAMLSAAGLEPGPLQSHGFIQLNAPTYMFSVVDRGADALLRHRHIGPELAESLKNEARRREKEGNFFGYIAFASIIARKPA